MSFNVKTISVFERQAKRLMKKFPSLKKEIQTLISELKEEPEKGTSIGHNCNKIRLAIASKSKANQEGQGSLPILFLRMIMFTFLPFTTNRTLKTLPIKKYWSL
jgi:hypothetical protein